MAGISSHKVVIPVEFRDTRDSAAKIIGDIEKAMKNLKVGSATEKSVSKQYSSLTKEFSKIQEIMGKGLIDGSDTTKLVSGFNKIYSTIGKIKGELKGGLIGDINLSDKHLVGLQQAIDKVAELQKKIKDLQNTKVSNAIFSKDDLKALSNANITGGKNLLKSYDEISDKLADMRERAKAAKAELDDLTANEERIRKDKSALEDNFLKSLTAVEGISVTSNKNGKEVKRNYTSIVSDIMKSLKPTIDAGQQDWILEALGLDAASISNLNLEDKTKVIKEKLLEGLKSLNSSTERENFIKDFIEKSMESVENQQTQLTNKLSTIENHKNSVEVGDLATINEQIEVYKKALAILEKEKTNLDKNVRDIQGKAGDTTTDTLEGAEANLKQLIETFKKLYLEVNGSLDGIAEFLGRGTNAVNKMQNAQAEAETFKKSLAEAVNRWFSLRDIINIVKNGFWQAVNDIKDLDKAMTNIAVVTDMSINDLWGKINEYMAVAKQYGVTTQGVYEVSQLYYQQGLNQKEVTELTTETLKLARVANMDYAKSADAMTVALRGFNMEMSQAAVVTDVYSKVAAITASDQAELANAMSKTASSAASVGSSFENTTAMLAVMVETTRESAQNLGSALKSIISRYGEMKVGVTVDSEGEELDYNKVDTALKSIGISLKDAQGQFRDFDDVIFELSEKWDSLDKNTQRYIATIMAGNRQQSRFIALVDNWERLKEVSDAAADSEDAGLLQYAKTMDSLETKINNIKTSFQQFYMGILNGPVIGKFLEFINSIIEGFNKLGNWQSILNLVSLISSIKTIASLIVNAFSSAFGETIANAKARAEQMVQIARKQGYDEAKAEKEGREAFEKGQPMPTEQGTGKGKGGRIKLSKAQVGLLAANLLGTGLTAAGSAISQNNVALGSGLSMAGNALSYGAMGFSIGGPWGAAIGAIAGLATSMPAFIKSLDANTKAEERLAKAQEEAEKANIERAKKKDEYKTLQELLNKYETLKETRFDNDENYQNWIDVNNQLVEKYPELIGYIDEEGNAIADVTEATDLLRNSMVQAAQANKDYYDKKIDEIEQEIENNRTYEYKKWTNGLKNSSKTNGDILVLERSFMDPDYDPNKVNRQNIGHDDRFKPTPEGYARFIEEQKYSLSDILEVRSGSGRSFDAQLLTLFDSMLTRGAIIENDGKYSFEEHFLNYYNAKQLENELKNYSKASATSNLSILSSYDDRDDEVSKIAGYQEILYNYLNLEDEVISELTTDSQKWINATQELESFYNKLSSSEQETITSIYDNLTKYSDIDLKKILGPEGMNASSEIQEAFMTEWYDKNYNILYRVLNSLYGEDIDSYDEDKYGSKENYYKYTEEQIDKLEDKSIVNFLYNADAESLQDYLDYVNSIDNDLDTMFGIQAKERKLWIDEQLNNIYADNSILANDPVLAAEFASLLVTDAGSQEWADKLLEFAEEHGIETIGNIEKYVYESFSTYIAQLYESIDSNAQKLDKLVESQSKGMDILEASKYFDTYGKGKSWDEFFDYTSEGKFAIKDLSTILYENFELFKDQIISYQTATSALLDFLPNENSFKEFSANDLAGQQELLIAAGFNDGQIDLITNYLSENQNATYEDFIAFLNKQNITLQNAQKYYEDYQKRIEEQNELSQIKENLEKNLSSQQKAYNKIIKNNSNSFSIDEFSEIAQLLGNNLEENKDYIYNELTDTYSLTEEYINNLPDNDPRSKQIKANFKDETNKSRSRFFDLYLKSLKEGLTETEKIEYNDLQVKNNFIDCVREEGKATISNYYDALWSAIQNGITGEELNKAIDSTYSEISKLLYEKITGSTKGYTSGIKEIRDSAGKYSLDNIINVYSELAKLDPNNYPEISEEDFVKLFTYNLSTGEITLAATDEAQKILNTLPPAIKEAIDYSELQKSLNDAIKTDSLNRTFSKNYVELYNTAADVSLEQLKTLYESVFGENSFAEVAGEAQKAIANGAKDVQEFLTVILEKARINGVEIDNAEIQNAISDYTISIFSTISSYITSLINGTMTNADFADFSEKLGLGEDFKQKYVTQTIDGLKINAEGLISLMDNYSTKLGSTYHAAKQLATMFAESDSTLATYEGIVKEIEKLEGLNEELNAEQEEQLKILRLIKNEYSQMADQRIFDFMNVDVFDGKIDNFKNITDSITSATQTLYGAFQKNGKIDVSSFMQIMNWMEDFGATDSLEKAVGDLDKFKEAMIATMDMSGNLDFSKLKGVTVGFDNFADDLDSSFKKIAEEQREYWNNYADFLEGLDKLSAALEESTLEFPKLQFGGSPEDDAQNKTEIENYINELFKLAEISPEDGKVMLADWGINLDDGITEQEYENLKARLADIANGNLEALKSFTVLDDNLINLKTKQSEAQQTVGEEITKTNEALETQKGIVSELNDKITAITENDYELIFTPNMDAVNTAIEGLNNKTITLNGEIKLPEGVELANAAKESSSEATAKLQQENQEISTRLENSTANSESVIEALEEQIAQKNTELAKKEAELASLKKEYLSPTTITTESKTPEYKKFNGELLDELQGYSGKEGNDAENFVIEAIEKFSQTSAENDASQEETLNSIENALNTYLTNDPEEEGLNQAIYKAIQELSFSDYNDETGWEDLFSSLQLLKNDWGAEGSKAAEEFANLFTETATKNPPTAPIETDVTPGILEYDRLKNKIEEDSATLDVFVRYNYPGSGGGGSFDTTVEQFDAGYAGNVSGLALYEGTKLANKTLVGELGPELAVYDNMYHLLGQHGAEFVDLPDDAIVFNHRQTEGIIRGQAGYRGKALVNGNVSGPAYASGNFAEAAKQAREIAKMWEAMASKSVKELVDSSGGGGGGNSITANIEDLEEWYNLVRQIENIEQKINNIRAERENLTDGSKWLQNLREEQALLEKQLATKETLLSYQQKQLQLQAKQINENAIWSKYLEVGEDGLLQYKSGNEANGGKGALEVLQELNEMSGKEQVAYLKKIGYSYTTTDGKKLKDADLVKQFYEELQNQIDTYDNLYDTVNKTEQEMSALEKSINDLDKEVRDNQIGLETEIYETLVSMREKEIEQLQKQSELIKKANEAYIDGIQKAIDAERKLYEQNEAISDREQLQRRLSLLRMSGGSASEIADLESQLNDTLKNEYFTRQEESLSAVQEASEKQLERLDMQISIMEENLAYEKEMGTLWHKIYEVMDGGEDSILNFLKEGSAEYFEASALEQENMLLDWAKRIGIYKEDETYKNATSEGQKLWNNSRSSDEALIGLSEEQKANVGSQYASAYAKAIGEGKSAEEADKEAWKSVQQTIENYNEQNTEPKDKDNGNKTSSADSKDEAYKYVTLSVSAEGGHGKPTLSPKSKVTPGTKVTINPVPEEGWVYSHITYNGTKKIENSITPTGKVKHITIKVYYLKELSKESTTNNKVDITKQNVLKYASGGLVDYTGIAQLDGSPSKPEAVLNPKQTSAFMELVENYRQLARFENPLLSFIQSHKDSLSSKFNNTQSSGDTINIAPGAVQIAVAQLNDRYDVDEMANDVMNRMVAIANKSTNRGVNRR